MSVFKKSVLAALAIASVISHVEPANADRTRNGSDNPNARARNAEAAGRVQGDVVRSSADLSTGITTVPSFANLTPSQKRTVEEIINDNSASDLKLIIQKVIDNRSEASLAGLNEQILIAVVNIRNSNRSQTKAAMLALTGPSKSEAAFVTLIMDAAKEVPGWNNAAAIGHLEFAISRVNQVAGSGGDVGRALDQILPELSARLGRTVTIEDIINACRKA